MHAAFPQLLPCLLRRLSPQFAFRGDGNVLVPEDAGEAESQFEGLQVRAEGGG